MDERLQLAKRLVESATHTSEADMRNSLSRMYYALFHAAALLVDSRTHGHIPALLDQAEVGLGVRFRALQLLRSKADYNPGFVRETYGDLRGFRSAFPQIMEDAAELYERLVQLVRDGNQ